MSNQIWIGLDWIGLDNRDLCSFLFGRESARRKIKRVVVMMMMMMMMMMMNLTVPIEYDLFFLLLQ